MQTSVCDDNNGSSAIVVLLPKYLVDLYICPKSVNRLLRAIVACCHHNTNETDCGLYNINKVYHYEEPLC